MAAAAVSDDGQIQVRLPDQASIFTAELKALLLALSLIAQSPLFYFIVFSDSLSSLMALRGTVQDNPYVLKILEVCSSLAQKGKKITFAWIPSHVGIRENEAADKAAKEALQLPVSALEIPYTDFKQHITKYVKEFWQDQWHVSVPNKLYDIQPQLGVWPYSCRKSRREEAVLARARIGHTYITHSFLLKGEPMPQCIPCHCSLSVKHILIDCVDFALVRQKYFHVSTM